MQYLDFKGSAKNGHMKPPVGGFRAAAQLQGCNFKLFIELNHNFSPSWNELL